MGKLQADIFAVSTVERFLAVSPDLGHLRVRRRGDLLTLESGPPDCPRRHARFRRATVHLWCLEMPCSTGWNTTPFRDQLEVLLEMLVQLFPWTLAP
jgi:hypothetical protein